MRIIELEKDILLYQFKPDDKDGFLGLNIFVVINGNECTVVETGFKRHFIQVLKNLKEKDITISNVIQTHFHPDHIGGIPLVEKAKIYGSIFAQDTLKKYVERYNKYLPTNVVVDKTKLQFGRHKFEMEVNTGHSKDGLLITLNDKYIFVGDEIILDNKGNASIPYCSEKDPQAHINSINKIMSRIKINVTVLPTHGSPLVDEDHIINDLVKRLTYLHFINENRTASYDDFVKATNVRFLGRDWHILNQIDS